MGCNHRFHAVSRRQALGRLGNGFGMVALSQMLNASIAQAEAVDKAAKASGKAVPDMGSLGKGAALKQLHFKPKASGSSS